MPCVIDGLCSDSKSLSLIAKKASNSQPKQANEVKHQAGHNLAGRSFARKG
jgi:hypothetical protein